MVCTFFGHKDSPETIGCQHSTDTAITRLIRRRKSGQSRKWNRGAKHDQ